MHKSIGFFIVLVGLTLGLVQLAQAEVGVTLKAGTTGVGGDLTFRLNENLNLRAGVSYFNTTQSTNEIDGELNLLNVPVLIDWHPFYNSGFRISTGVMFSDNYLKLSAHNQEVTINDEEYDITKLNGKIDFNNQISPYLGIGWGNAVDTSSSWHFSTDLGVAFVGSPNVSLHATAVDPTLQAELDNQIKEQISTFKDDASQFQIYPVLTIGLSYSF